jgi:hypothetical protein
LNNPVNNINPTGLITIKIGGRIYVIHPNDPDPLPSSPHAHILDSPYEVDMNTGEIFDKTKSTGANVGKKTLAALRNAVGLSISVAIILDSIAGTANAAEIDLEYWRQQRYEWKIARKFLSESGYNIIFKNEPTGLMTNRVPFDYMSDDGWF